MNPLKIALFFGEGRGGSIVIQLKCVDSSNMI